MRQRSLGGHPATLAAIIRVAAVLAWALASPALAQGLFDDTEARRRIDTLRQQLDANQRSIDERLGRIESAATDRGAILDLASQLEALRNDVARMRGQLEGLTNQAENADKRQKDLYLDIDTRLRKLEQTREGSAATDRPPEAEATPAENKAYQAALDQFKLGNYPLAVSAMQGFLVTYPGSPLASNAQYWVGMAYSGQRDYKSAIAAQRKLLATWPQSGKASDALLASSGLQLAGAVDLSKSIYPGPRFTWLSYIAGGFLFGVGMTLGSGCGSKTLIRIGGGNLKSVIVYVFLGIAAYMTLRGILGAFRVGVLEKASFVFSQGQDLPSLLSSAVNLERSLLLAILPALIGAGIAPLVSAGKEFRANFNYTLGGVVTGLVVAGGWDVSGHIGYLAADPRTLQGTFVPTNTRRMESFSFVAPLAFTLDYLMFWTDKSRIVTYGIASVAGVIAGSAAYAIATRKFRWEGFRDAEDTGMHILGGLLMGFGGICALGCTMGQALTGISTLALGSIITFACIVAGSAATMKWQYWRISRQD